MTGEYFRVKNSGGRKVSQSRNRAVGRRLYFYSRDWPAAINESIPDEKTMAGGLLYWIRGHQLQAFIVALLAGESVPTSRDRFSARGIFCGPNFRFPVQTTNLYNWGFSFYTGLMSGEVLLYIQDTGVMYTGVREIKLYYLSIVSFLEAAKVLPSF